MKKKLQVGVGAECSVLIKYLHPRKVIQEKYVNTTSASRLEGLVAISTTTRMINKKPRTVIIFRHDDIPNKEIYCAKKFCGVKKEGAAEDFFTFEVNVDMSNSPNQEQGGEEEKQDIEIPVPVPNVTAVRGDDNDDIIGIMRSLGIQVEDDNEPLPENVPNPATPNPLPIEEGGLFPGQSWSWSGLDDRKMNHVMKTKPKIKGLVSDSIFVMFELFFPSNLTKMIFQQTNTSLGEEQKMIYGEFIRWIGLQLLMSTCSAGNNRRLFWSEKPISAFEGVPFRLNEYMSRTRFDKILQKLSFTSVPAPTYCDKFWVELTTKWNW